MPYTHFEIIGPTTIILLIINKKSRSVLNSVILENENLLSYIFIRKLKGDTTRVEGAKLLKKGYKMKPAHTSLDFHIISLGIEKSSI